MLAMPLTDIGIREMDKKDNNPAIVLVHGFWGGSAHWHKVIIELARKGPPCCDVP